MAVRLFTNNAKSTLASGITDVATSLTVASGEGALFPNPSGGDFFMVTLDDGTNIEIVKVTARATDVFTIVRAQEGTPGTAFLAGDKVELRTTKETLEAFLQDSDDFIHVRDEKPSGTDGGTFTSGAWRTRDLNTEVSDTGGHASVASNQITLAAGTYRCFAIVPAFNTARVRSRLQNVDDAVTLVLGVSENTNGGEALCLCVGRFTLSASKVIELQHRTNLTTSVVGFGRSTSFDTEVYATVMLWKEQ